MKNKFRLLYFFSLILIFSCKHNISIKNFDSGKWKGDKGGCKGERESLIKDFVKIKNQLKGHSSNEIIDFLGNPDREDLYSGSQKFYYYYLKPGQHCSGTENESHSERITIRFNAMNRATEVNHLKGDE